MIHDVTLFLDSTWSSFLFLFVWECLTSVYAYRLLIPVICCHVAQAVCDFRRRETQTAPVSGIARLFQQLQNVFDWLWKVRDIWSLTVIDCRQILQKNRLLSLRTSVWKISFILYFVTCFGPLSVLLLHENFTRLFDRTRVKIRVITDMSRKARNYVDAQVSRKV